MGLAIDLAVDPSPEAVVFTVTVTNNDTEPHTLTFPTAQSIDVTVSDGDDIVWEWSADRMFAQSRHDLHLDPGDNLTATASWEDPRHGTYEVEATVMAANRDLTVETVIDL